MNWRRFIQSPRRRGRAASAALRGRAPWTQPLTILPRIVPMLARVNSRKVYVRRAGYKGISPLAVALVEGRRRAHRYPPGTTDSLLARKAKAAHQINPVVAQSKIGHALDGFYARDFDLRQGRCRGFGRPQSPRLLRMCHERACRSHAYK